MSNLSGFEHCSSGSDTNAHHASSTRRTYTRLLAMMMAVAAWTVIGTSACIAQPGNPTPCVPDCADSPWGKPQTLLISPPGFPSCQLIVIYVQRIACGIWHDFQILNIYTASVGCDAFKDSLIVWGSLPANDPRHITNQTRFLHNFLQQTIANSIFNAWYSDQSTTQAERDAAACPGGTSQWRAIRSSCVAWSFASPCCPSLVKCGDICCLRQFRICRDVNTGQNQIFPAGGDLLQTPCPEPPTTGGPYLVPLDGHCMALCDDADWPGGTSTKGDPKMSSR